MTDAPTSRRKPVPLRAQLHAALRQLGWEPHEAELDHDPALALRDWDAEANDTVPPANDPRYLVWRPVEDHRAKTFGPGGEKRVTTAGGDIHAIAKAKRLARGASDFDRRLLAKATGEDQQQERRPTRKIASRPFPKRKAQ